MTKPPPKRSERKTSARAPKGSEQIGKDDRSADTRDRALLELREAVRARDDFIVTAAHELRNPLTPIQLCVELIRAAAKTGENEKLETELGRLEHTIGRFLKRTSVVLNVARITGKALDLRLSQFNLSEAVRNAVDEQVPVAVRSGSPLHLGIEENIICFQDEIAIGEIIENLLSNAIKYGAGKPIELAISTRENSAYLTVRDHGLGIGGDETERIFERFERAVRRTHQPGFGLGLWITRNLVEAMGGSISVTGEKGAGSLFTITFPLNGKESDE
jgi:two-component system, OmpR family, sensor kinase